MANSVTTFRKASSTVLMKFSVGCENCFDEQKIAEVKMIFIEKPDSERFLFECPKCHHKVLITLDT